MPIRWTLPGDTNRPTLGRPTPQEWPASSLSDQFYILASQDAVRRPPPRTPRDAAFDPYGGLPCPPRLGLFDPGPRTGAATQTSRAALEVRSREVPFMLTHGQVIARLIYEQSDGPAAAFYGHDRGSHYQDQGTEARQQFKPYGPSRRASRRWHASCAPAALALREPPSRPAGHAVAAFHAFKAIQLPGLVSARARPTEGEQNAQDEDQERRQEALQDDGHGQGQGRRPRASATA